MDDGKLSGGIIRDESTHRDFKILPGRRQAMDREAVRQLASDINWSDESDG
jgi:hypothetical protein